MRQHIKYYIIRFLIAPFVDLCRSSVSMQPDYIPRVLSATLEYAEHAKHADNPEQDRPIFYQFLRHCMCRLKSFLILCSQPQRGVVNNILLHFFKDRNFHPCAYFLPGHQSANPSEKYFTSRSLSSLSQLHQWTLTVLLAAMLTEGQLSSYLPSYSFPFH